MNENKTTKQKKVLLIEDDEFYAHAYQFGLKKAGFEVVMAHDGIEGLEKAQLEKPDLIFLDLVMPKKDGFQVLEELKNEEELKNIPVIILSNLGQEKDMQEIKELGAIDYFIKTNLSMDEIIKKVKFYLLQSDNERKNQNKQEPTT